MGAADRHWSCSFYLMACQGAADLQHAAVRLLCMVTSTSPELHVYCYHLQVMSRTLSSGTHCHDSITSAAERRLCGQAEKSGMEDCS